MRLPRPKEQSQESSQAPIQPTTTSQLYFGPRAILQNFGPAVLASYNFAALHVWTETDDLQETSTTSFLRPSSSFSFFAIADRTCDHMVLQMSRARLFIAFLRGRIALL